MLKLFKSRINNWKKKRNTAPSYYWPPNKACVAAALGTSVRSWPHPQWPGPEACGAAPSSSRPSTPSSDGGSRFGSQAFQLCQPGHGKNGTKASNNYNWFLVSTPLKNMKVRWDDCSHYMDKIKMFQTTNQIITMTIMIMFWLVWLHDFQQITMDVAWNPGRITLALTHGKRGNHHPLCTNIVYCGKKWTVMAVYRRTNGTCWMFKAYAFNPPSWVKNSCCHIMFFLSCLMFLSPKYLTHVQFEITQRCLPKFLTSISPISPRVHGISASPPWSGRNISSKPWSWAPSSAEPSRRPPRHLPRWSDHGEVPPSSSGCDSGGSWNRWCSLGHLEHKKKQMYGEAKCVDVDVFMYII